jgi:hypothetical protein
VTVDTLEFDLLHREVLAAGAGTAGIDQAGKIVVALRIVQTRCREYAESKGSRKFHGAAGMNRRGENFREKSQL